MWCVITGFLKDHSMEAALGCSKNLCGLFARWAWVPLEHREAVLVVHEVADRGQQGLGSPRRDIGSTRGAGLGKGSLAVRSALWMEACFHARAVLASCICGLGCGAAFCFPACAVLATCICGVGRGAALEVGEKGRGGGGGGGTKPCGTW